jgi:hypothetical protein
MPKSMVDCIVPKRVLNMDKITCERLLKSLIEEKKEEDARHAIRKQE